MSPTNNLIFYVPYNSTPLHLIDEYCKEFNQKYWKTGIILSNCIEKLSFKIQNLRTVYHAFFIAQRLQKIIIEYEFNKLSS